jgi:AcrR family transcriptional regulator
VLFARAGVAATSLNTVAEHAGFSRGAVHGNYSGKDELVAAVAETIVGEIAPRLRQTLTERGSSGARLSSYIRAFLAFCAENPDAAGALIAVTEHRGQSDRRHYHDRAVASLGDLTELFQDGQRRGEMRVFDPTTMAFALRTVLDNTAAYLCATGAEVGELATEIVALFAAATRSDESA